jgi:hypothetical protein
LPGVSESVEPSFGWHWARKNPNDSDCSHYR